MPRLIPVSTGRQTRRGVSLPEVLIVIMILGIVGGAIFKVLVKQQQSYTDTSRQADMQREIRLTSSFLPSDLRSLSSAGSDIIAMEEDRFSFLATIGSAIVCSKTSNTHFSVPPTDAAGVTTSNWHTLPIAGDSVFLYNDSLDAGSVDDVWQRARVQSVATSLTDCPGAPFTDPANDAGKARWRFAVVSPGVADSVRLGAVVRFARPVRYRLYQVPSRNWYVGFEQYVSGAWSAVEPVGGPFRPYVATDAGQSGLQFRYFDSLGVRLTSVAQNKDVSRIDVYLRTNAGLAAVTERRPNDIQDSVMMRIAVRNFK
jgi:prepilin-type N-terminal cleavage/methylation domain-containing protein